MPSDDCVLAGDSSTWERGKGPGAGEGAGGPKQKWVKGELSHAEWVICKLKVAPWKRSDWHDNAVMQPRMQQA